MNIILSMFARRPTPAVTIKAVESVREMILPHLTELPLIPLSEFACLYDPRGFYQKVGLDHPRQAKRRTLDIRGVYGFTDRGDGATIQGTLRTIRAWGLSEKGDWLEVSVLTKMIPYAADVDSLREEALHVSAKSVALSRMLKSAGTSPGSILGAIKLAVEKWEASARTELESRSFICGNVKSISEYISESEIRRSPAFRRGLKALSRQ